MHSLKKPAFRVMPRAGRRKIFSSACWKRGRSKLTRNHNRTLPIGALLRSSYGSSKLLGLHVVVFLYRGVNRFLRRRPRPDSRTVDSRRRPPTRCT